MTVAERLADGMPPLRAGELARIIGWSYPVIRKLMDAGIIAWVVLVEGGERRVPVRVARELAERVGVLQAA